LGLGYEVLQELGLVREDREGDIGATPRLLQLFAEAYYDRLADEMINGKYPCLPRVTHAPSAPDGDSDG
jgi:hypothetical protein